MFDNITNMQDTEINVTSSSFNYSGNNYIFKNKLL